MNVLECHIIEIFEERELTEEEKAEWNQYSEVDPNDLLFVCWKYNSYDSCSVVSDYMLKSC